MSLYRISKKRFSIKLDVKEYITIHDFEVDKAGIDFILSNFRKQKYWSVFLDEAFKRWVYEDLGIRHQYKYYQQGREL